MVRLLATGVVCNVGGVRSNMACVSPGNLDLLPLHVHSNRGIVIAGCAVAELLVIVLAPAVGDAIGGHRARKMFPRTERGEGVPTSDGDWHRAGDVGAIAQRTVLVVSPAKGLSVRGQPTGDRFSSG